ncbi:MAG: NAD(P)-dependent oxidoreductase [Synergistaceae bacterium]|nr:NAD(P)-dependent oxidoreductase [Synergistaceae bacterium]
MQQFPLGFIGFGEAAYNMGKGLRGEGFETIRAYDVALDKEGPYRDTVLKRCEDAKITAVSSAKELVENSDVVVIAVPARFTASTAEGLIPFARAGQLFVDVTTALPDIKAKQAEAFAAKGAEYIDSAMLGSLMLLGHKVPILASGKGSRRWHDLMTPFNMKIGLVNKDDPDSVPVGEASRIKLVRSVFMKGIEALIVETMLFARKCGIEDNILDSITGSMDKESFRNMAVRMAAADLIHSERRSFEVGESMELMKAVGVEPVVAAAVKERLAHSAALGLNEELHGVAPKEFSEIYALWEKKQYK